MDREQQQRRIRIFRRGIVGGSVAGALGVAGLLGFHHTAAAATNTSTGTDGTSASTTGSGDDGAWSGSFSGDLSAGSGSSHATTAGS